MPYCVSNIHLGCNLGGVKAAEDSSRQPKNQVNPTMGAERLPLEAKLLEAINKRPDIAVILPSAQA